MVNKLLLMMAVNRSLYNLVARAAEMLVNNC